MTHQLDLAAGLLPEALDRAWSRAPDRGVTLFDSRGRNAERRRFSDLAQRAHQAAGRLRAIGVRQREPVVLALPTSWAWLEIWLGCVELGAWPVAVSPGGALGPAEAQIEKVEEVMGRIGARHLVASEPFRAQSQRIEARWAAAAATPESLEAMSPQPFRRVRADPEETAFLQLTSGSTGLPRAVMISHRAVLHQLRAENESLRGREAAPAHRWVRGAAAWLPLYHDMGLLGCLLLPFVLGIELWLLRPETFLARPRLWLQAVSEAGPSYNPAPNFSFQLCVDRIRDEDMAGVDLSAWRCALNGAEMVRPETTRAFCDKFAPFGFAPETFVPCYGMAESTLAATIDLKGQGVRTVPAPAEADSALGLKEIACVGEPLIDTEIRIEAPDGRTLPEDHVGQILIKSPSVFSGYYRDPGATAETLRGGWLATGDLGFLRDGELYITGRLKDLLIIRGQNVMPEEFERLADGVIGGGGILRSGAFSISRGGQGEQPVLVVEVMDRSPAALPGVEHEIRRRVGHSLGLPLADLIFVRRGRLPRTTSGKIQRRELKRLYLEGALDPILGEAG